MFVRLLACASSSTSSSSSVGLLSMEKMTTKDQIIDSTVYMYMYMYM